MKLCRDCKWSTSYGEYSECTRPSATVSLVTGEAQSSEITYCATHRERGWLGARMWPKACGKEGRWFEPK